MSFIYTPMPLEALYGWENKTPEFQEIEYGGAKLLVEPTSIDKCRVVRLFSTNPADYLRNEFQPGAEICFTPRYNDQSDGGNMV